MELKAGVGVSIQAHISLYDLINLLRYIQHRIYILTL